MAVTEVAAGLHDALMAALEALVPQSTPEPTRQTWSPSPKCGVVTQVPTCGTRRRVGHGCDGVEAPARAAGAHVSDSSGHELWDGEVLRRPFSSTPVDLLAEQVGVPGVAGVLLDQVGQ